MATNDMWWIFRLYFRSNFSLRSLCDTTLQNQVFKVSCELLIQCYVIHANKLNFKFFRHRQLKTDLVQI